MAIEVKNPVFTPKGGAEPIESARVTASRDAEAEIIARHSSS